MAGRRRYDDFGRSDDIDRSEGWVDDVGADDARLAPVVGRSMRLGGPGIDDRSRGGWGAGRRKRREAVPETSVPRFASIAEPEETGIRTASPAGEFARIGRRGVLRPELFALLAGAVFIVAALLKPWANPASTPALAARQTALATSSIATAVPAVVPASTATVNIYALIPPYNYREGQWPPPELRSPGPAAEAAWAAVDWSFLNGLDDHPSWGVAAITLPSEAPNAAAASPDVSWVEEIAPWKPSEVLVPRGSSTYALAVTWPAGIRVESISFDYLSYDSPKVGVTPVPAAAVATPVPPSTFSAPEPTPAPTPKPGRVKPSETRAPLQTLAPDSGTMVSGAFWIPPSGDLSTPAPQSVRTAWQAAPWVWPLGSYRITLATNAGQMIVAIRLRQV